MANVVFLLSATWWPNRTRPIFNSNERHLMGYQCTKFQLEILKRSQVRALLSFLWTDAGRQTDGRTDTRATTIPRCPDEPRGANRPLCFNSSCSHKGKEIERSSSSHHTDLFESLHHEEKFLACSEHLKRVNKHQSQNKS